MAGPKLTGPPIFRVLRVVETALLLACLGGIATFAVSIFSIFRIESAPDAAATTELTREIPWSAWYGIFIFLAAMLLLQVVRTWLHAHRREDGTPRADARGMAADTTAEALSADEAAGESPDADLLYSGDEATDPGEDESSRK